MKCHKTCLVGLVPCLSMRPLIGCPLFTNTAAFVDKGCGRSLYDKLCIMWSVFDDDGHKRGQTSLPVIGRRCKQIVTLKWSYIIVATIWALFSVAALYYFIHHKYIHSLIARPHWAFQSQCYITKFKKKVILDLTSSREKQYLLFFDMKDIYWCNVNKKGW